LNNKWDFSPTTASASERIGDALLPRPACGEFQ
jgi:hypothetical protein